MTTKGADKGQVMSHDPLADLDAGPDEAQQAAAGAVAPENQVAAADDALQLGECLGIADVGPVQERLRELLDRGAMRIDAGDLEQVDAAGVQLLCSAVKDARRQEIDVQWVQVSDTLTAAARQLGLGEALGL